MKVKDLLQSLSQLDPELDVMCYSEASDLLLPNHLFRLLEIDGVSEIEGERLRGEDGVASLKLGKSDNATKIATIEITPDF
jgi:hypothetical protein